MRAKCPRRTVGSLARWRRFSQIRSNICVYPHSAPEPRRARWMVTRARHGAPSAPRWRRRAKAALTAPPRSRASARSSPASPARTDRTWRSSCSQRRAPHERPPESPRAASASCAPRAARSRALASPPARLAAPPYSLPPAGLRGARHHPPVVVLQHGADRAHLPGPAPAAHAALPAPRRPHRLDQPLLHRLQSDARRGECSTFPACPLRRPTPRFARPRPDRRAARARGSEAARSARAAPSQSVVYGHPRAHPAPPRRAHRPRLSARAARRRRRDDGPRCTTWARSRTSRFRSR